MIFFAVTKPKKKLAAILKIAFLVVLLAYVVPTAYTMLADAGALADYAQAEEEQMLGEPIRVLTEPPAPESTFVNSLHKILYGEDLIVEVPVVNPIVNSLP